MRAHLLALAAVLAALLVIGFIAFAEAHPVPGMDIVYDRACCNSAATHVNGDCAPIDDEYVTERSDGYHINIPVGGHPKLKTRGYSAVIPYRDGSIRNPLDNRYHICLTTDGSHRYCLYPKPGAV